MELIDVHITHVNHSNALGFWGEASYNKSWQKCFYMVDFFE